MPSASRRVGVADSLVDKIALDRMKKRGGHDAVRVDVMQLNRTDMAALTFNQWLVRFSFQVRGIQQGPGDSKRALRDLYHRETFQ